MGAEVKTRVAANDNDEFRFYVYCWCYPDGRPFYVGKGNGRRDAQPKNNKMFRSIVSKIIRGGGLPKVIRWHERLREVDAFMLERSYIKLFGRRDRGTGVLANMTDGGDGVSGFVFGNESLSKLSASLKAYCSDPSVREKKSLDNKRRYENSEERLRTSLGSRMAPPAPNNKTGFKGVSSFGAKYWRATINADGKQRHLGLFDSPSKAACAYDHAATIVWGAGNCYLNLPEESLGIEDAAMVVSALDTSITSSERQATTKRAAPAHADSASGIKGVVSRHGKWVARIRINGKLHHLGSFSSPVDAARAYDSAAIRAWGMGNCYLNHPVIAHNP